MKKARTLSTKRWVCALLVCALLLTPSLTLAASVSEQAASAPELAASGTGQAAAETLSLESIPDQLAQTLELDELSPLAELNNADTEQLNSLTISNGDGTSTAYIFQGPIKYLDKETNSIKFIDNKLKESSKSAGFLENYAYENTSNDIKVYLPKKIKKGVDIEYENISVNMRPEIINNEKGVLKEYAFAGENMEVLEYPDAFGEGCHLQYQPLNRGLKENILVEEYNGMNTFSFELKLKKGYAEISEDNRIIYIKDEQGETVFILNQPYARDSFTGIDANLSHRTFDDYYILEQTGNKTYRVTMVIDESFLSSAETVYPVLIDPTATISSGSIQDITALSNGVTQSPLSEDVTVGYFNGTFYTAYQKNTFIWYYRFMNPSNITNMVHKAYVSSLTNTGFISVYDSNEELTIDTDLTYSVILSSEGALKSSTQVTGQGWYEFDITALGREWLKYETRNYGNSAGKSAGHGYIFSFGGPGVIILASADSAANSAYISFNYTEDTSLSNGTYIIRNNFTRRAMQDSGSSVLLNYGSSAQANLRWIFTKDSDGLYTIKNAGTGRYIYFAGSAVSGSILQAGATQMKWRVIKNTNGSYRFFPVNSIYALEERYFNQSDYKVYAEGYNGYTNQQWGLEPVATGIVIQDPTSSSIGYIRNYHEYFKISNNAGTGLAGAKNAELTSIILDLDSPYSSKQSSVTLQAELTPSNSLGNIVWSSSNTNVATVNSRTGLVTAVGHGWTTITARYSGNSAVSDSIIVIVPNTLMDVELELQETKNWCWVTSVRMIMKYYFPEITASQEQGVRNSHDDIDENTPISQINLPGNVYEAADAATYYSNNKVEAHIENFPSENDLRAILDEGNPVYLTEHWTNGNKTPASGGHARVIYGYYEYSANNYVYLIHDPYQYRSNNIIIKTQMSYANMLDETEEGIEGIDTMPDNGAEWEPGKIIYWTVK